MALRVLLAALALSLSACATSYAPPIRSALDGVAGTLDAGDVELGASGLGPELGAAASLRVGLSDRLAIELGGERLPAWATVGGALRWTFLGAGEPRARERLTADVEVGGGGGLGGERVGVPEEESCDAPACFDFGPAPRVSDGRRWHERTAAGAWIGGGVALWLEKEVAVTARSRMALSDATGVPMTFWWNTVGGVAFTPSDWVTCELQGGLRYRHNAEDFEIDPLLALSLALRLDLVP